MHNSSNKRTVWVGLFVSIGLIFLIAGILMIGNLHETFKKKMKVTALFDNVGGLQAGNNVWFSGVKIGIVSGLHFYKDSQVEVTIRIDVKAQEYIRKDSKIKIGSDGLIGNKILEIYGGSLKSEIVQDGDVLKVEKTFTQEDMVNTLQENNKNLVAITRDLKVISAGIASGEGTLGKFIFNDNVYENIHAATASLKNASAQSVQMIHSLNDFSSGLNKRGTLAHELVTDTVVFRAFKTSVMRLSQMADTASVFITDLKASSNDTNTPVGVLLHDKETGAHLKGMIKNLESGSKKLDEDLEAAQHSFLLRGYFRKKEKAAKN
ncbi:MAG: MCE family protein [Cyclobacteriaceae bacterium]|nr:MCE family protein [Cyclobacteriaceae bacterium]